MHVIIMICVIKKNKRISDPITWFYYLFNYTIFFKASIAIRTILKIIQSMESELLIKKK